MRVERVVVFHNVSCPGYQVQSGETRTIERYLKWTHHQVNDKNFNSKFKFRTGCAKKSGEGASETTRGQS